MTARARQRAEAPEPAAPRPGNSELQLSQKYLDFCSSLLIEEYKVLNGQITGRVAHLYQIITISAGILTFVALTGAILISQVVVNKSDLSVPGTTVVIRPEDVFVLLAFSLPFWGLTWAELENEMDLGYLGAYIRYRLNPRFTVLRKSLMTIPGSEGRTAENYLASAIPSAPSDPEGDVRSMSLLDWEEFLSRTSQKQAGLTNSLLIAGKYTLLLIPAIIFLAAFLWGKWSNLSSWQPLEVALIVLNILGLLGTVLGVYKVAVVRFGPPSQFG